MRSDLVIYDWTALTRRVEIGSRLYRFNPALLLFPDIFRGGIEFTKEEQQAAKRRFAQERPKQEVLSLTIWSIPPAVSVVSRAITLPRAACEPLLDVRFGGAAVTDDTTAWVPAFIFADVLADALERNLPISMGVILPKTQVLRSSQVLGPGSKAEIDMIVGHELLAQQLEAATRPPP